jgi:NAD(P)-dependent dehydrogenase (short-subunit alcohol dehydrogenase family)
MSLRSDATYVLAGGIGGVGRGLAYFLVSNGAKNLLFLSRSAASAEDNRVFLEGLRKEHCIHALAYDCDVTINASLEKALRSAQKTMPPVKGVVMGAMVLQVSRIRERERKLVIGCLLTLSLGFRF